MRGVHIAAFFAVFFIPKEISGLVQPPLHKETPALAPSPEKERSTAFTLDMERQVFLSPSVAAAPQEGADARPSEDYFAPEAFFLQKTPRTNGSDARGHQEYFAPEAFFLQEGHGSRKWLPHMYNQQKTVELEEETDLMFGVPKIVWVIIADILAIMAFTLCLPVVMYIAKKKRPDFDNPDLPEGPSLWGFPDWCPCAPAKPAHSSAARWSARETRQPPLPSWTADFPVMQSGRQSV